MEEALRFFKAYEVWIYVGLGVVAIWYIRKFALAWDDLRGAAFGMERDKAQSRLNQAAVILVLLLIMAVAEFVVITFIVPTVPGALPLPTPTLDLLATATTTLPAPSSGGELNATLAPALPGEQSEISTCNPEQVMISTPTNGDEVSGVVTITGTADIPDFGFYKFEIARPGESVWLTILAGREVRQEANLGEWDTSALVPGDYQFRLVVTDNRGEALPPCVIQVRVVGPP